MFAGIGLVLRVGSEDGADLKGRITKCVVKTSVTTMDYFVNNVSESKLRKYKGEIQFVRVLSNDLVYPGQLIWLFGAKYKDSMFGVSMSEQGLSSLKLVEPQDPVFSELVYPTKYSGIVKQYNKTVLLNKIEEHSSGTYYIVIEYAGQRELHSLVESEGVNPYLLQSGDLLDVWDSVKVSDSKPTYYKFYPSRIHMSCILDKDAE